MKKILIITGLALVGLVLVGTSFYFYQRNLPNSQPKNPTVTVTKKAASKVSVKNSASVLPAYFFPMTNFSGRILYRWFGKYVNASDVVPDCGAVFVGYHDGDDLETTAAEKTVDVPVYAVADGIIRQASYVSGYGGLLIMQATLGGQVVTINYGHIRLSSVSLKAGEAVKAGQQLAVLGTGCSTETDGERKHLHFAIHLGSQIDVAGYVATKAELANWLDPKVLLTNLKAVNP